MLKPTKMSIKTQLKNSFLTVMDEKGHTSELREEKKWEELSTGPNCL